MQPRRRLIPDLLMRQQQSQNAQTIGNFSTQSHRHGVFERHTLDLQFFGAFGIGVALFQLRRQKQSAAFVANRVRQVNFAAQRF